MLKFFFYRQSFMVYLMNALVLGEGILLLYRRKLGFFSGFLLGAWALIQLLDWIPWYPRHRGRGKLGIRLHFQKNIVPVAYLMALAFSLKLLGVGEGVMAIFAILMLPVFYVSFILLYFHFRDKSSTMPSYFTHNFYLNEKENS